MVDGDTTGHVKIVVRRAIPDDLAAVVSLRIALLREYDGHPVYGRLHPDAENRARPLFEQQIVAPGQAIFLASIDEVPIGIARCAEVRGSPLLLPDRYCYVSSTYVRPEFRRRGVLSRLMETVEKWATDRGLTEMRLHNSTLHPMAREAWTQLGFDVNEEVRLKSLES
jgi:GNAT superfamily N-acetyltransferase